MDGINEYENLIKVILKEKEPETEEEKEEAPPERKKPKASLKLVQTYSSYSSEANT